MANTKLSDKQAKQLLLSWPLRTRLWPIAEESGYWMRCQPKDGRRVTPRLFVPGSTSFGSQPDGLWCFFGSANYCDVIAIESCGTFPNLFDKRSRFAPSTASLALKCKKLWLDEEIVVQRGSKKPRWVAAENLTKPDDDIEVSVRFLRVLYSLPDKLYEQWYESHIPAGHEYFCPHSVLGKVYRMRGFLQQLTVSSHFY